MQYIFLLSLICMSASVIYGQITCGELVQNYNIFGDFTNRNVYNETFTIVIQMPVLLFMERSIQNCLMVQSNSPLRAGLGINGRLFLYRYDNIRLFKRSESVKLTFYGPPGVSGATLYSAAVQAGLSVGNEFPIDLRPMDATLGRRVQNINSAFRFRVTYFGVGPDVGVENYDSSNDRYQDGFSLLRVEDYFYIVIGIIFLLIILAFYVYGFMIQPYYL